MCRSYNQLLTCGDAIADDPSAAPDFAAPVGRPGFTRRNRAAKEAVGAGYPSRRIVRTDEFEVGQLPASSRIMVSSTAAL